MTDTSIPTAQAVLTATLAGHARVGETSDFRFRFTDARTGTPVTDQQPYLGAAGHVAIVKADGSTFARDADGTVVTMPFTVVARAESAR